MTYLPTATYDSDLKFDGWKGAPILRAQQPATIFRHLQDPAVTIYNIFFSGNWQLCPVPDNSLWTMNSLNEHGDSLHDHKKKNRKIGCRHMVTHFMIRMT